MREGVGSSPTEIKKWLATIINDANRTALPAQPPIWSAVILSTAEELGWLFELCQAEWIKNAVFGVVFCVDYLSLRKTCPDKQEFYFSDFIGLLTGVTATGQLSQAVAENARKYGWHVAFVPDLISKIATLQKHMNLPPLVLPISILVLSNEELLIIPSTGGIGQIHWGQYEESNLDIKSARTWWTKEVKQAWQYGRVARYLALEQMQTALGNFGLTVSGVTMESLPANGRQKENVKVVLRLLADQFTRPYFSLQRLRLNGARMMLAMGNLVKAESILSKVLEREPSAPDILVTYSVLLWLQGKHEQALNILKQVLKQLPKIGLIHYLMGEVYREQGLLRQAEDALRQSLKYDPNQLQFWLALASAVEEGKGPQAALTVYKQARSVIKPDATFLNNEGLCYSELGQNEKALSCYQQALVLKPNDPSILANRGLVLGRQGKIEAALQCYEKALKASPNDVYLLNNKGFCLGKLEQYEEALRCYEKALLGCEKDDTGLLHNKATCLTKLGRHKEALACYDQVLQRTPTDTTTLNNRGLCLLNLGRLRDALECYRVALQLEPGNAVLWGNKGACLFKQGKYEEALTAYERALELAPNELAYYSGKGMCLDYLGRAEEAVDCYNRALRLA